MAIFDETDAAKALVTPVSSQFVRLENQDGTPAGRLTLGALASFLATTALGGTVPTPIVLPPITATPVAPATFIGFAPGATAGLVIATLSALPSGATRTLSPPDGHVLLDTAGTQLVVGMTAASAGTLSYTLQDQAGSVSVTLAVAVVVAASGPTTVPDLLSFTGPAGLPTGALALTQIQSNPLTGMVQNGGGALSMPSDAYAYALLKGLGTVGDGAFEIHAANGPQPLNFSVYIRSNAAGNPAPFLLFQSGSVAVYGGAASPASFNVPATFSILVVTIIGQELTVTVDGAQVVDYTGTTFPTAAGYVGFGSGTTPTPQAQIASVRVLTAAQVALLYPPPLPTPLPAVPTWAIGAQPAAALSRPLLFTNANAVAASAPMTTFGHTFAKGDVPYGSRAKIMSGGTEVPSQWDGISHWPDGSWWVAQGAALLPDSFAANGGADTHGYTITSDPTPPSASTSYALADWLAVNDVFVDFQGFDCGADTYVCSFRNIVRDFVTAPWDSGLVALAAPAAAGATTLTLASAGQVTAGMLVTGKGVPAKTLVTAISNGQATISNPLSKAIAVGGTLTFNAPLGGWQELRTGKIIREWHAWQYLQVKGGANDGKRHTQVRCDLYIMSWGIHGPHEVYAWLSIPNTKGNIPGGTIGPAGPQSRRFVSLTRVCNGSTVLKSFGGPNDTKATTIPASAFSTSDGSMAAPAGGPLAIGYGNGFGFYLTANGGTLPGDLQANTPYWTLLGRAMADRSATDCNPANWAANTAHSYSDVVLSDAGLYRCITPGTTGSAAPVGATPAVDGTVTWQRISAGNITSQGSGTFGFLPVLAAFPFSSAILASDTAEPIWDPGASGIATRPNLMPTFDPDYITRRCKALPPFDTTIPTYPRTSGQLMDRGVTGDYEGYFPGQAQPWGWIISQYGDDPGDERVGLIPQSSALLCYQQSDKHNDLLVRSMALGFADYTFVVRNELSGLPVTCNGGPAKSPNGVQYPGCGPVDVITSCNSMGADPLQSPPTYPGTQLGPDWSGHEDRYGPLVDSSHMPMLMAVPYLRTGHTIYRHMQQMLACTIQFASGTARNNTVAGTTYYTCTTFEHGSQMRGDAWATKIFDQARIYTPDSDVLKPFFQDVMDDTAAYLTAYYPAHVPAGWAPLGMTHCSTETGQALQNCYQYNFLGLVLGMLAWRDADEGRRPGWLGFLEGYAARWLIGVYDADAGGGFFCGPNGGPGAYGGNVQMSPSNVLTDPFQTPAALWALSNNGSLASPQPAGFYPGTGVYQGGATYPFDTVSYYTGWAACLAMWTYLPVPKAKVMWQRWKTASTTAPCSGIVWAQNGSNAHYDLNTPQSYMPWAIAPTP